MGRPRMDDRRNAVLAVYLPPKILRKLRTVAYKERRTASTQALVYIERALLVETA